MLTLPRVASPSSGDRVASGVIERRSTADGSGAPRAAHPPGADTGAPVAGMVVRSVVCGGHTCVDVAGEDAIRTVRIDAVPDAGGARRVRTALRRVSSVRFDVSGPVAVATVRGLGHRTPRRVVVDPAAGLALVCEGVVGMVVRHGEV